MTDIHPGGQAHFHCDPSFQVRGHEVATCLNSTRPHWSTPEPQCMGEEPLLFLYYCYNYCFDLFSFFKDGFRGFWDTF